jgi:hypothetical protein
MPFAASNDQLTGRKPIRIPAGGELVAERFTIAVTAGELALNNVGVIGLLPAGCVPVDVLVDSTDVDTGAAAMVLQVGISNAGVTDISTASADGGAHWGVTTAANTAFTQRLTPNGQAMVSVAKSDVDRRLAIKVGTAPTTPAAGTLGVTLIYRAA